jgi:isoleucyl-tRNA synthetase
VDLGRSARSAASVRTRQPLGRALIGAVGFAELPAELRAQIADELNVAALEVLGGAAELVDYTVKPNFRALGRRFGARTQAVAGAITAAPAADIASVVLAGGTVAVTAEGLGDDPVLIGADDVIVTQTPRAGWAVATEGGETVALDMAVSPELRREGLAREVVRLVQDARKTDGLDVTDRIWLRWSSSDPDVATALAGHGELIAGEVLAVDYGPGPVDVAGPGPGVAGQGEWVHENAELGLTFWLGRATAPR